MSGGCGGGKYITSMSGGMEWLPPISGGMEVIVTLLCLWMEPDGNIYPLCLGKRGKNGQNM